MSTKFKKQTLSQHYYKNNVDLEDPLKGSWGFAGGLWTTL